MKKSLLALTLLAAAPFAASAADGVTYNYVDAGYVATNGDGGADADGWGLKGSAAIAPNFHLFGEYADQKIDNSNISFDQWRVGVGYNRDISPRMDLVTRVAYEKFDAGNNADFDGYSAEVGINGAMTNKVTGYALVGYEDGDQYDGDFYGRLGAKVKLAQNWSATADVKFADGATQWFVGPRFTW